MSIERLPSLLSRHKRARVKAPPALQNRIGEACPSLEPQFERGVSLAVDGTIYGRARFTSICRDGKW